MRLLSFPTHTRRPCSTFHMLEKRKSILPKILIRKRKEKEIFAYFRIIIVCFRYRTTFSTSPSSIPAFFFHAYYRRARYYYDPAKRKRRKLEISIANDADASQSTWYRYLPPGCKTQSRTNLIAYLRIFPCDKTHLPRSRSKYFAIRNKGFELDRIQKKFKFVAKKRTFMFQKCSLMRDIIILKISSF